GIEAADHVEQRRLAGAVRADERADRSAADREAQPVERDDAAEADADVLDPEQRLAGLLVGVAHVVAAAPGPHHHVPRRGADRPSPPSGAPSNHAVAPTGRTVAVRSLHGRPAPASTYTSPPIRLDQEATCRSTW